MDHCSTNAACSSSVWSWEENKAFENALAVHSGDTNSWEKIAAAVPGRTVEEIKHHFNDLCADVNAIESGLVPLPQYAESSKKSRKGVTCGIENNQSGEKPAEPSNKEGSSHSYGGCTKGMPWSQEEHRLFLQGLKKYGRGDWRSISRNCVLTRTSTQVASHAQKYFKRHELNSTKKRSSIHDMTITEDGSLVNLQGQTDGTHDTAITDEENLVNLQGQTNEGKDTAQPVTSVGSSSTLDNIYAGYDNNSTLDSFMDILNDPLFQDASFDGHEYPILGQSDLDVSDYLGTDQIDMLCPWAPQTGGDIGVPAGNNLYNMSNQGVPVSTPMVRATRFGYHGFAESSRGQLFPQCSNHGQRNTTNIEGNIINVGGSPSGFGSGFSLYGPQTARQPELPPVASNVDVPSRFAPPVTATNESGASSSAGVATDLVFDEKNLDLLLSSDWNYSDR